MSASEIVATLNLTIGKSRVQNILAAERNIKYKNQVKKPQLTHAHKVPDDSVITGIICAKIIPLEWAVNFDSGSVMILGGFVYHGKLKVCFITMKMDSKKYI